MGESWGRERARETERETRETETDIERIILVSCLVLFIALIYFIDCPDSICAVCVHEVVWSCLNILS